MHHPPFFTGEEFREQLLEQWTQMNLLLQTGLVRAIGVSNFYDRQLEILFELCQEYSLQLPCVNQIELHPSNQNWDLVNFCHLNGIQVVAHTPLGGLAAKYILQSEIIQQIGLEIGVTPAQVVLASTMKRGIGVIPRSLSRNRMKENFDSINFISSITEDHLERLRSLDSGYNMIVTSITSFEFNNKLSNEVMYL